MKNAIISVYNKTGLDQLVPFLSQNNYRIYSTGGTFRKISELAPELIEEKRLIQVSDYTQFPEILNGRVKTLHPLIYGGLLAKRNLPEHLQEASQHGAVQFDLVVCNLYPFKSAVENGDELEDAQELIDIGGVTLIRAAAKNFQDIVVLTDPKDYESYTTFHDFLNFDLRRNFAIKAYQTTSMYDAQITNYLMEDQTGVTSRLYQQDLPLKYGCNPHQSVAGLHVISPKKNNPFTVMNGVPGFINLLDAIGSWQLVKEAKELLRTPCAASFKHTSPAGVATCETMSEDLQQVYGVNKKDGVTSPLAQAYLRARNSDPMSSFGDFIALSEPCDVETAHLIRREVSDGIIAPGYDPRALDILSKKKNGKYIVLKVDPNYTNTQTQEFREMFGIALSQPPNRGRVEADVFDETEKISTMLKDIPDNRRRDLLLANITLKYSQSNNVAMALDGQVVAIASGQQSRVDCVKLCVGKLKTWYLRQHPKCLKLLTQFRKDIQVKRQERINAVIAYINGDVGDDDRIASIRWKKLFEEIPEPLTEEEKEEWINGLDEVSLASDAFFPFRDNIDHASKVGVKYVMQPGGSTADPLITEACDQYDMMMVLTNVRQFTH